IILELKRRYFEDYYFEDQHTVSIKEDMAYLCLHSPKTTKETRSIRRIQRRPIRCIRDIVCEYSGRYAITKDHEELRSIRSVSREDQYDVLEDIVWNILEVIKRDPVMVSLCGEYFD
ncbi:hypothetical protein Tco_0879125, partial [Tanacetum coccineum]